MCCGIEVRDGVTISEDLRWEGRKIGSGEVMGIGIGSKRARFSVCVHVCLLIHRDGEAVRGR